MTLLRGMLLDVDGTLVDSNDAHARSWVETLAEHGIDVPYESVRRRIGEGSDKLLPAVAGIRAEDPLGRRIVEERSRRFLRDHLPHLRPCRGARALVLRLREAGLRLVVATSARDDELEGLLRAAEVDDLVREATTSDDAERSKPDPDIVVAAVRKSGLAPAELLLLGDTPYDVEAARRAGVETIALRSGGWGDEDLAGAIAVYDDPADLLARWASSPAAKRIVNVDPAPGAVSTSSRAPRG